MIAGFIFLRLRGILGKRTGFEGKAPAQFKEILKTVKQEETKKINENFDDKAQEEAPDLFANMFDGKLDSESKTEFYVHDQNWTNRMILGDSLQVMASLAEREGLRGKVQAIYIDPPEGINFSSNFIISSFLEM